MAFTKDYRFDKHMSMAELDVSTSLENITKTNDYRFTILMYYSFTNHNHTTQKKNCSSHNNIQFLLLYT